MGNLARLGLIYCTGAYWYVFRVERPLRDLEERGLTGDAIRFAARKKATNLALRSTAFAAGNLARSSSHLSTRDECCGSRVSLSLLPSAVCISVYSQPNQYQWVMALVDHCDCDSPGGYPGIGMIDGQ